MTAIDIRGLTKNFGSHTAVGAGRTVLHGSTAGLLQDTLVLLAWATGMFILAVVFFRRRLKGK